MSQKQSNTFIIPLNAHSIIEFLHNVGRELHSHGYQIAYIPQNKKIAKTAEKTLRNAEIYSDYVHHEPKTEFWILCKKYGIHSPKEFVFPEMVYDRSYDSPSYRRYHFAGARSLDYNRYQKLLHRTLDYLDILYEGADGGVPLQFQGAEVLRRALDQVADYHGYTSVRTSISPVPGELLFRSNEEMSFPIYEGICYEQMTDQQRRDAKELRKQVVDEPDRLMGETAEIEPLRQNIQRKVHRILEYRQDIFPVAIEWIRRHIAKPVIASMTKSMYLNDVQSQRYIESNRYIFYPIQYFRESRVTMRAPEFYNQLWLIEYLSRSLPPGYDLVVKDHPQQLGALPISHVRAINRYTIPISPSIPGRKVITHADAIVTLNNTVGYEAVMHGKPVITLGDAFYSGLGFTQEVPDLNNLPKALWQSVESNGLEDEEVLEFAHGVRSSSYRGIWGETNRENVESFTDSLLEYLSENRPPS